jgi:hypothetical protein
MMRGKKGGGGDTDDGPSSSSSSSPPIATTVTSPTLSTNISKSHTSINSTNSKHYKRHQQARQAFWQCWKQDWCHTKDMVDAVLESVVDLKGRLRLLHQHQQQHVTTDNINPSNSNPNPYNTLTTEDINLALQYTYRKYEHGWQQLRGVVAQLAVDHQTLGRRLQEVLTTATEVVVSSLVTVDNEDHQLLHLDTTEFVETYQKAAMELFQKQTRAQTLFNDAYEWEG